MFSSTLHPFQVFKPGASGRKKKKKLILMWRTIKMMLDEVKTPLGLARMWWLFKQTLYRATAVDDEWWSTFGRRA